MFTEILTALEQGREPDQELLRKRFQVAMTKKLAVVRLPPAFWMQDPKINPRTDQLLWVALLLGDRQDVELVTSILAVEYGEKSGADCSPAGLAGQVRTLADQLVQRVAKELRSVLQRKVETLLEPAAAGE